MSEIRDKYVSRPSKTHVERAAVIYNELGRGSDRDEATIARALAATEYDAIGEGMRQAATTAAIHSQYPIESDFDRGYSKSAEDAANRIRRRAEER